MNILMIHGVDTNEDANPNPYAAWQTAITNGLNSAGFGGPINADPVANGSRYNDIFDKYPDNPILDAIAVTELLASAGWHAVTGAVSEAQLAAVPPPAQPGNGPLDSIRWTAGMVSPWVVESGLRSACRDRLVQQIQAVNPDVIIAHSLGTLLAYDLFVNDERGKTVFPNGIFVTFGSQIANPFVASKVWPGGDVEAIPVKMWYNLYNPNDPVFVSPITLAASNFHQFTINPPFGNPVMDVSAHEATTGSGHPGYLDNPTTNANLWPALAGGTTANLIAKKIRIMKRVPRMLVPA